MEDTTHLRSTIWLEEPEPSNAFACRTAYCHGYDVYGQMLGNAGWAEMVYLLFRGEAPSRAQASALDLLAVALANPGPRDAGVHAAMCAGVSGNPAAAALMAALAVSAGGAGGAREVYRAMQVWASSGKDLDAWKRSLREQTWRRPDPTDAWPSPEHPAGFEPLGVDTPTPVLRLLARLSALDTTSRCAWLEGNLAAIEGAAECPLALVGVAAAAFADLGMRPEDGEMLFLLLRLPGAAAHALEQHDGGHKRFPFYDLDLEDPPSGSRP
jgi:citrate synthase